MKLTHVQVPELRTLGKKSVCPSRLANAGNSPHATLSSGRTERFDEPSHDRFVAPTCSTDRPPSFRDDGSAHPRVHGPGAVVVIERLSK